MARSVLLIDDSATLREAVCLLLTMEGFEVAEAPGAAIAMEWLERRAFDLVICDLRMPDMDGIAFVRHLRAHDGHARTPVLMLTVEDREDCKRAARAAGVTAWLGKPFSRGLLLEAVQRLVAEVPVVDAAAHVARSAAAWPAGGRLAPAKAM